MLRMLKYSFCCLLVVLAGIGIWSLLGGRADSEVFTVVIDPGHGGSDPGAVWGGAAQKDLNLAVALKVRALLEEEEDIRVLLTREEDSFVALYDRAEYSNQRNADLFLSIHANALEQNHDYEGILTFYHKNDRRGRKLAELVQAEVSAQTGGTDRGIRDADYVVLRESDAPSCLLEMGFMTTQSELDRLLDPEYQDSIAAGIVQGIRAYQNGG